MAENLAADDLAGLEALGAYLHLATLAILDDVDVLDVGTMHAVGDTVGVADAAAGHRVLAANLANLRHFKNSFARAICGMRRNQG